ncbi:hypothetical protein [Streptomyces tubercidicus]|uniref:hypothetical protein n=1 Tax=Streptomyces tubercidicus TaxID=47759 RepID=UPI0034659816
MPKNRSTAAQRAREAQKITGGKYTAHLRDAQDAPTPQGNAAMLAGLEARSLAAKRALSKMGQPLRETVHDRLERCGTEYLAYLKTGHEAALEALEYAVAHGVDAVDDGLAEAAARKGHPIGPAELEEALRRVRDHSLLLDGSTVAETAYWVADRYWMHRWNKALDQAPIGKWDECVGPQVYRRLAVHEWMSPGVSDY